MRGRSGLPLSTSARVFVTSGQQYITPRLRGVTSSKSSIVGVPQIRPKSTVNRVNSSVRRQQLPNFTALQTLFWSLCPAFGIVEWRPSSSAAPGGELHAFGTTGIAAVKVPTLILVTATDQVVKPGINALWAYDGISSIDKALGVFDKGAHQLFMYSPEPQFNEALSLTTAFFLDILKGDTKGKNALRTGEVLFPGLTYKSTLN